MATLKMNRIIAASLMAMSLSVGAANLVDAETVLQGSVCSMRVHELTSGIKWYNNLEEAQQAAQQQGKLVFWMHMLGKIDGAT